MSHSKPYLESDVKLKRNSFVGAFAALAVIVACVLGASTQAQAYTATTDKQRTFEDVANVFTGAGYSIDKNESSKTITVTGKGTNNNEKISGLDINTDVNLRISEDVTVIIDYFFIQEGANVTFDGPGTIKGTQADWGTESVLLTLNGGTFTMNGGTLEAGNTNTFRVTKESTDKYTSTALLKGGTIKNNSATAVTVASDGDSFTVDGVTIQAQGGSNALSIRGDQAIIKSGTIKGNVTCAWAATRGKKPNLDVLDGTIEGNVTAGGTADGSGLPAVGDVTVGKEDGTGPDVKGTIIQNSYETHLPKYEGATSSAKVYGGNFNKLVNADLLPTSKVAIKDAENTDYPYSYVKDVDTARAYIMDGHKTDTYCSSTDAADKYMQDDRIWHSLHKVVVKSAGGTVETLPALAFNGDALSFTVKPAEGLTVGSVSYANVSDSASNPADGTYSFTMPDNDVVVTVSYNAVSSSDDDMNVAIEPPTVEASVLSDITEINPDDVKDTNVQLSPKVLGDVANEIFANANQDNLKQQLIEKGNEDVNDIYVHVLTDIELNVTSYNKDEGLYVVDITPYLTVIASTESTAPGTEGGKTITLAEHKPIDVKEPSTITIPIPTDFADEDELLTIRHDHGSGKSYYTCKVTDGVVSFVDDNGFSPFTITKAKVGLDSLSTSPVAMAPVFDPDTLSYNVSLSNAQTSLDITVEAHDDYTVDVKSDHETLTQKEDGTWTLSDIPVGTTTVTVTVTHGDQSVTYTITVTRAGAPNTGQKPGGTTATTVRTEATENGSFTVSDKRAKAGDTVTITPAPNEGYEIDQVSVTDKNGNPVEVKANGDGTYSFTMPENAAHPLSVTVTFKEIAGDDPGTVTPEPVTVYRLYNRFNGAHLVTTDKNEYATLPTFGWTQEGIAFTTPREGEAVYRLYNPNNGDHIYTIEANEYQKLQDEDGWVGEDIAFYSAPEGEGIAVYRLYNPYMKDLGGLGAHLWTTDTNEYDTLHSLGWNQEGEAWRALS